MPNKDGLSHKQPTEVEPIAIVGMAFEFAGDATSEGDFWQMLCEGRSSSTEFPSDRLNIDGYYDEHHSRLNSLPLRGGHFLKEDLGAFDAPFFSISPAEAAAMDPQHRRMLEVAYHALENAGIPLSRSCGSQTSVYTGCFSNDYMNMLQSDQESEQRYSAVGIAPSMLANRLSWFFDFKGVSANLDSACSSSLLALHLACRDLHSGSASMALVGGSNLMFHPSFFTVLSNFNFLSPDSQCWSFDDRANGYARGEGLALLVVKRLADAINDGDNIRAVIRNTDANQDGRTSIIIQPDQDSQVDLLKRVYHGANLDMAPTRFFEAHGTGTEVGDPIEAGAIAKAFANHRSNEDPLYIGATKANIGHIEGGSGLAGVIKTVLVLEHGIIPPIARLENVNHKIDTVKSGLHFPRQPIAWPTDGLRRACVSSFGFGGTNAVVVLDDACNFLKSRSLGGFHQSQEYPTSHISCPSDHSSMVSVDQESNNSWISLSRSPQLLVCSASSKSSAIKLGKLLEEYTTTTLNEDKLAELAYSLMTRRSHLSWRTFRIASIDDTPQVKDDTSFVPPIRASEENKVAFLFTGQGAQWIGMGNGLSIYPAFEQSLHQSDKILKELGCSWSASKILEWTDEQVNLELPEYSQTLTTCLQIALVDLMETFGVRPSSVLGHSSGEIAAAYASGFISHESAIRIVYWRGKLASQVANAGKLAMMVIGASREAADTYIQRIEELYGTPEIYIACVNSHRSITLSGSLSQLETIQQWCEEDSVFVRKLRIPVAYHSPYMEAIKAEYTKRIENLQRGNENSTVMISSVTGDVVTLDQVCCGDYWIRNLVSTVEFQQAFSSLMTHSQQPDVDELSRSSVSVARPQLVLEIGPHNALQGPVRDCLAAEESSKNLTYIPSLIRDTDQYSALLKAIGTLYCHGLDVNVLAANGSENAKFSMPERMPPYPFDHTQIHWNESRLSKNLRFRENARHELLGSRSLDWNPLMAQWRNTINLGEMPWLEDHKINGVMVIPAAATIVMVLEALRQLMDGKLEIHTTQFRRVTFLHPLQVSEQKPSLPIQLNLTTSSHTADETDWVVFRLFALENNTYRECCHGSLRAFPKDTDMRATIAGVSFFKDLSTEQWTDSIRDACRNRVRDVYATLGQSRGTIEYGPLFRNVNNMFTGQNGEASADLVTETLGDDYVPAQGPKFAIHPAELDGVFQLAVLAMSPNDQKVAPGTVVTRIDNLWIDTQDNTDTQMKIFAQRRLRGKRGAAANIVVVPNTISSDRPFICIEGLQTTFIDASTPIDEENDGERRHLRAKLAWKPDIDLLGLKQIPAYCHEGRPAPGWHCQESYLTIKLAIASFIAKAVAIIDKENVRCSVKHLRSYIDWMRYQMRLVEDGTAGIDKTALKDLLSNNSSRADFIEGVAESGKEGHALMTIGKNIVDVLRGDVDPMDLLFQHDFLNTIYEQNLAGNDMIHPLKRYIELLTFKHPSMKILEIGAGTGSQTRSVLESLSADGIQKCLSYDYTDISPRFFERARESLTKYADVVRFQTCDISRDPVEQSFEAGTYDLILAGHVLHATNDLHQSLTNIRKLLKPDGKLVFSEQIRPESMYTGFFGGLLSSWWDPLDHEERAELSPCIRTDDWDQRLRQAGFTGVEIEFANPNDHRCSDHAILVTTVAADAPEILTKNEPKVAILQDLNNEVQTSLAGLLKTKFQTASSYSLSGLEKARLSPSTLIVILLEVGEVFLDEVSCTVYNQMKEILLRYMDTIWVTKSQFNDRIQPQHHMANGFGRSLCSEDRSRRFVTLALDRDGTREENANALSTLASQIIQLPSNVLENDYAVQSGRLEICRIIRHPELNEKGISTVSEYCHQEIVLSANIHLSLQQCDIVSDSKFPYGLEFYERCVENKSSLEPGEVDIKIEAFGLTHRDALQLSGQLEDGDHKDLLLECAGTVEAVHKSSHFKVGDRVMVLDPKCGDLHMRTTTSSIYPMPDRMSFVNAAALPTACWMAYHTLIELGRLQEGETVLIHRAGSVFSQIAIQFAKRLGANILVSASTDFKRELLSRELAVQRDAIFDAQDPSLIGKIKAKTAGEGVDLVVSAVGLDPKLDFLEALAPFGRLLDINPGVAVRPQHILSFQPSNDNFSQAKVDMVQLFKKKPHLAGSIFQKAMAMASEINVQPPCNVQVFVADKLRQAAEFLQDKTTSGKVIVKTESGTMVTARIKNRPKYGFDPNATYVIAGGLGGLGRCMATWMVDRGARHLILLSRSGAKSEKAKALLWDFAQKGVHCATPEVDVSNLKSLQGALREQFEAGMPPVKGCIQAAVALADNLFENMTHSEWSTSTRAKVTASWNLHQAFLDTHLDFFILLSSVGGLYGPPGVCNYTAGNTFKDALARYRVSMGLKATSIDLGLIADEGAAAESDFLIKSIKRQGYTTEISTKEFLVLLDHYCDPSLPVAPDESEAQIIMGLQLPTTFHARGDDPPYLMYRPIASHLFRVPPQDTDEARQGSHTTSGDSNKPVNRGIQLSQATDKDAAVGLVLEWFTAKLSSILGVSESDVNPVKPIKTLGIDSLVALDLRTWIQRQLGAEVTTFELIENVPLAEVCNTIVSRSQFYRKEEESEKKEG